MFRGGRSRRGTPIKKIFFAFILAIAIGGLFAFLTNKPEYSQVSWESKSESVRISIAAPDTAFGSDVKLATEKVNDSGLIALAKRTAGQNSSDVLAFNITFTDKDDNEIQPNSRVKVSIRPEDYNLDAERYALVHIDDNYNAEYLGNIAANDTGELVFFADSFSIYAIIPTTQTDQQRYARRIYEFYIDDELAASQIVRDGDILNAPAAPNRPGLIFMGWYTENDRVFNGLNLAVSIPDDTTADKTVKLHARFADKIYSVVFYNQQGNVLATKTGTSGDVINTADIRHEVSAGKFIDAWTMDPDQSGEIPDGIEVDEVGDEITITNENIKLYPVIRSVKWARYDVNDRDADEYTASSYVAANYAFYGHPVDRPNDPVRNGYNFVGWATDPAGNNMYDFSTPMTSDIQLYAIWQPKTNTQYRIVFWKEALSDGHYIEGNYEYASHTDTTGTSGNTVTVTQNQINQVLNQSDFTYYELDHAEQGAVIHGDGSTVVNVYLKLKVYTVNFTVETVTGTGNRRQYCFNYYNTRNTATTTCQSSSHATNGYMTADYTSFTRATHDLTQGYSFEARMGEIISDRYPGTGEIQLSYNGLNNIKAYAWRAVDNNPTNTTRVSKPVTMTTDLLLSNQSGGTTLYLFGAMSTSQITANYWFEKADGSGYERSEEYSFTAQTTGSGTFNGRTLTGYDGPLSTTPSGYSGSNTNTGVYNFYYNRQKFNLHFYNYNTPGNSHSNIRHGASLVLYDYIPERPAGLSTAYTFQGWYTTPECIDGTEFDLSTGVMPMSDLMLYAKWENTNYVELTFNPNGGDPIPAQRVLYGSTARAVNDPVRTGYSFVGWRRIDGSFFSFDNVLVEDTELVASWVPFDTIYVHYDPNGGVFDYEDNLSYVDTSTAAILPEPEIAPEGKYFVGWNVNGRIYYPGNIVMILLSDIADGGDTITITAEWGKNVEKTSYTYSPNSASGEEATFVQEQNEAFVVKTPAELGYEKTGYSFIAWNSEPDGSGVSYYAGTQWAADNRATLPNILYAQWRINCYTVTVNHIYANGTTYDETQSFEKCYNETYETSASTKDDTYYGTVTSGEASGTITDHDVTVVYTYKKRDAVITVNHINEQGDALAQTEEIPGTFDDPYAVNPSVDLTPYYDYTSDMPLTGVVHGDLTINITYTKKHFTLTVQHQYEDGSTYDGTQTFDKLYLDPYEAIPSARNNNYKVVRTEGSASGTITGDTTVVFIYAKKQATLTVNHRDANGNTLADAETLTVEWGDPYSTNPDENLAISYNYTTTGDSASGIVGGDITVNYIYTIKSFTITVHHVVTDGETTIETQAVNYGDACSVSPKPELLTAYNVSQSGDSCDGAVTSDKDITYTYTRKQFTLTVHHRYADGSKFADDETFAHPYGYEYTTSPLTSNVDYAGVLSAGNASGTITDNTEVTYTYNRIQYVLTVRHHDMSGNPLMPDETFNYESGDTYTANPDRNLAASNNYTADIATSGIIRSNITVTFTYQVKTYTVTVHHVVTDGDTTTETISVTHGSACPAAPKSELLVAYNMVQSGDDCGNSVTSDLTVTYTYTRKQFTLTIQHQYEDGSKYDETRTSTLAYGAHYDAAASNKDNNYEVVRTEGVVSGDITDNTTVTFVYAKKQATLTVNHQDANGNTLAETQISTVEWGDPYSTNPVDSLLANRDFTTTGSPASGTVSGDITVNYIYTLKKYTFTVQHLDEDGNPLVNSVVETLEHGSTYNATPATSLAALYNHTPEIITGTIVGDLTVSFTYTKKIATIIVHHVDIDSGNPLVTDETFTMPYGEIYTTKASEDIPDNYEYANRSDNYTDTAMTPSIEVTYYYQKKDASLSSSIAIIDGADTLGNDSQSSAYELQYTADVDDFLGNANVTIVNTLPYAIDADNSELDGGAYDPVANTITWIETIDIAAAPQSLSLSKSLNLTYLNIPHTDRVAINRVEATIVLDTNKSRATSASESLAVAYYGNAIVHYYIEESDDSIVDDLPLSGLIGDNFTVEARGIDGYELLNPELAQIYSYADDAQEITFFYHKKELPPEPDNPNTNDSFKALPGVGAGITLMIGLIIGLKRRRF